MNSIGDVRSDGGPDNREQLLAAPDPLPTAGRRGAVRLLGLGMALLGALGVQTATATTAPQSSQAEPELIGKIKTRRGKRGRKGRQGKHGPKGPGGEPGGSGSEGPEGPAGPSSGAFLGLLRDTEDVEVTPGAHQVLVLDCPAANPGERIVAVGGGFDAQVLGSNGFFMTSNRPSSDTQWIVGGFNTADQKLFLGGYIVCARFTA